MPAPYTNTHLSPPVDPVYQSCHSREAHIFAPFVPSVRRFLREAMLTARTRHESGAFIRMQRPTKWLGTELWAGSYSTVRNGLRFRCHILGFHEGHTKIRIQVTCAYSVSQPPFSQRQTSRSNEPLEPGEHARLAGRGRGVWRVTNFLSIFRAP